MRTTVLNEARHLEAIASEWRALLAECASPAPVSTPAWLLTWWSVFGPLERRHLRAVTFRDASGNLIGLAPLLRRFCLSPVRGLGGRRIELLASGESPRHEISSDFIDVLARRGSEQVVADSLASLLVEQKLGGWDELRFTNMGRHSPFLQAFESSLRQRGCLVEVSTQGASPFIALPPTWDDYLQAIGGRKRYFVRRTLRDITTWAGEGQLALHEAVTPSERRFAWDLLGELHEMRWASAGASGVFADPEFRAFHERIVFEPHPTSDGAVQLLWLTAADRPIAALYNIVFDNKIWFYQMGRTVDVPSGIRPGIAIHLFALRKAIEDGKREYDFLGRERFYKLQLSVEARERVTLRAVRKAPLPLAWELTRRWGRVAIHAARRFRKPDDTEQPDLGD